ncbi:hypothetical protein M1M96_01785 [Peptococcaceae bacterium]|nr:hypothetical protein [Peptococcaceae bacterium]
MLWLALKFNILTSASIMALKEISRISDNIAEQISYADYAAEHIEG